MNPMKFFHLLFNYAHPVKTGVLTDLANKYGSDKGTEHACKHNYTQHYEMLFQEMRNDYLQILEIGLNLQGRSDCASLCAWLEYFPNSYVYGIDIKPQTFSHPRVSIWQGDQSDPVFLNNCIKNLKAPLDIIIDDGSHFSIHQRVSLIYLFKSIKPGGFYIIEDLKSIKRFQTPEIEETSLWLRSLLTGNPISTPCIPQDLLKNLIDSMESIEFLNSERSGRDSLAVIRKKDALL